MQRGFFVNWDASAVIWSSRIGQLRKPPGFHKVRENEPRWLSDQQLTSATDRNFGSAVIYDTDYLDAPVTKKEILPTKPDNCRNQRLTLKCRFLSIAARLSSGRAGSYRRR